jgi:hypothetical protein
MKHKYGLPKKTVAPYVQNGKTKKIYSIGVSFPQKGYLVNLREM